MKSCGSLTKLAALAIVLGQLPCPHLHAAGVAKSQAAASAVTTVFPTISTYALDKQKITLPTQLEGDVNLLLLSFARDQDAQLASWTAIAQALQHTSRHFRAYRIPVAERENGLFRWWANASLRSDETDPQLWHWTVPVYVDMEPFRASLRIPDEKNVVALLVDRTGRVLWRATGASTAEARTALSAAVRGAH